MSKLPGAASSKPRPLCLESLPNEIQYVILTYVTDLKSLLALVQSSPRFFRVYRTFRDTVLTHIASNQIPEILLPIALWIHASATWKDRILDYDHVRNEYETLHESNLDSLPSSFRSIEVMALLLHDEIVEDFIADYTSRTLQALERFSRNHLQRESSAPDRSPIKGRNRPLSAVEHYRLKRAFYNLEFCGILHNASQSESGQGIPSLARKPMNTLSHFELEEIMCVAQYLIQRAESYLDRVEDDIIQVLCAQKTHVAEPLGMHSRWANEDVFFPLALHSFHNTQTTWTETCLTRGFKTLKIMFTANTYDERSHAFGSLQRHNIALRQILTEALQTTPFLQARIPGSDCIPDDVNIYNSALWWSRRTNCSRDCKIDGLRRCLRDCGYAIWDRDRLDQLKIVPAMYKDWSMSRAALVQLAKSKNSPQRILTQIARESYRVVRRESTKPSLGSRVWALEEDWRRQGSLVEMSDEEARARTRVPLPDGEVWANAEEEVVS